MVIRVVSLFCGGGFAEEALRLASEQTGIATEVVLAVDSWEPAARVRDANLGGVRTTVRSVKEMTRDDLPPHDLVIGGPPCQDHSLAGKRACRCNVGGEVAERCCLADFVRLASGSAWLMENVRPRLIRDGWSEQFCAADFGDVTSRKRWFYSSHLLHVVPTPGPRRIRDIRDHAEDARVIAKRNGCKAGQHGHYVDTLDTLDTLQAHSWHGHDVRGSAKLLHIVTHRPRTNSGGIEPYATVGRDDGFFGSLTADAPHANSAEQLPRATLRLGRGHANEATKLEGCRNPSLLEMARAHSIPDSWDWAGTTKTQRGQIIANGWPISMGVAVCAAMLKAIVADRVRVA